MKYLFYIIYILEFILIVTLFQGNEYPEDVIGSFVLLCACFVGGVYAIKNRVNNKLTRLLSLVNIVVLVFAIYSAIDKKYYYFFENWKGMTYSQYKIMIVLGIIVLFFQVIKIILTYTRKLANHSQ